MREKEGNKMIELGKMQSLQIVKLTDIGVFLNDNPSQEGAILLPKKQVPEETQIGDQINVFIYRDTRDRLIATTRQPKIGLGEIALLKVVQTTKIGAFLDWGLEKDLLLPFTEQKGKVQQGKEYVVGLYVDKSNRLCATMDVQKQLKQNSPFKKDEWVEGIIYRINPELGAFVAVEKQYDGLIPTHELIGRHHIGDQVSLRVTNVRDDGKLDLSIKDKAYKQMDTDTEKILEELKKNDGILYLHDKSDPEEINQVLHMSKGAFKRAVGRLMKEKKIVLTEHGIKLL